MCLIRVRVFYASRVIRSSHSTSEHIKYPDSSKPPPVQANGRKSVAAQPQAIRRTSGEHGSDSPNPDPVSDNEEARRAVSPTGRQNGTNGIVPQMNKGKGREYDGESSPEGVEHPIISRESAVSPDGGRAKSPASRAVSPTQGPDVYDPTGPQASLASVMMARNGAGARSPSPNIDRSRGPADAFYKPASPTMNGFAKPGSTGNVMADLIRDLKDREAEIEAMKKKESWMKAALLKAERSGFIYAETEEELSSRADDDDIDGRKVTEMVINLKQLKAKIQVRHSPPHGAAHVKG